MLDDPAVRKILVVKLRAIGDVLLSTVVLPGLRSKFPQAKIDFLTEGPAKDVLVGNSAVNEIIAFYPRRENGAGLILNIRRRKYDLVIDLFGNPRSALVTLFSGARYRAGYRFGWRRRCYNIVIEPRGGEVHNTEFNLDALRALGIPVVESVPEFPLGDGELSFARDFFQKEGIDKKRVVAVNAGGGWSSKRWSERSYAELADRIAGRHQVSILLLWGPGEQPRAKDIRDRMKQPAILIPPSSLKELGAILRRCDVLVTNDSGPMHIAAALGTPVVAIFGPTNPELQGPVGAPHIIVQNHRIVCLGCNFTKCPIEHPCMEDLQPDEVYAAFTSLFSSVEQRTQRNSYEKTAKRVEEKK